MARQPTFAEITGLLSNRMVREGECMRNQRKVLVIGLDGADYSLINEFKRDLPTLKELIDNGIFGRLKSTIPHISPTAWASFMTAKNPAKHGIFDFVYRDGNHYCQQGTPISSLVREGKTLWGLLSSNDKSVGVFNVPVTYPVEKVKGFLIGGFPVPEGAHDYTYPRELRNKLKSKGWDFSNVAAQSYSREYLDSFLDELYQRISERTKATLYLMDEYEWDFFMVHYMETDKIQHEFLYYKYRGFVDKKLFQKYGNTVKQFFVEMDSQLRQIINALDENTDIFVISDHGFAPIRYLTFLDTWLLSNNYMRLKSNLLTRIKYLMFRSGITPERLYNILPESVRYVLRKQQDEKPYLVSPDPVQSLVTTLTNLCLKLFLNKQDVEWCNTKAYSYGNTGSGTVFVNRKGREPQGMIENGVEDATLKEKLKSELRGMINPFTQKPVFDKVHLKEEIYSGTYISKAPDMIALGAAFQNSVINHHNLFLSNRAVSRNSLIPDRAGHSMNGIFIAWGPDIKRGKTVDLQILDVGPTILHLMDIPIPKDVDGKILNEIFEENSEPYQRKIKYSEEIEVEKKKRFGISKEDEGKVMERLRRMGYIV